MSMLHTVNKSPLDRTALKSCIRLAAKGSAVLLIEDGIYGAIKNAEYSSMVANAVGDLNFYVMGPDLKARGISEDKIIDGIKVVGYGDFVDLVTTYDTSQAWL
jgi:tRNA 2-thiouridine synthesizing protein B